MSLQQPTHEPTTDQERIYDELPMSTHELMLGVDITIHAQRMYHEMTGAGEAGGLDPDPEIHAAGGGGYQDRLTAGSAMRRYLAHWARRNLHGKTDAR
jgi:hypothetical protein